jgi:hypothetical protein
MPEPIRNLDEERFPLLENFRSLKRNNELLDPNPVSRFLAWLLLDANPEIFMEKDPDFRDEALTTLWGVSNEPTACFYISE